MNRSLLAVPALVAVLLTTACGGSGAAATSTGTATATETAASAASSSAPPAPAGTPVLAPAAVRAKAAAVLRAADAKWHAEFEKGAALTGAERVDWFTAGGAFPVRLATANMQAFSDANQLFTADNEPASVTDWRDAFSQIPGDVQEWYNSDTGHGYDPKQQAKVEADFAAADQLTAKVAAGG